MSVLHRIAYFQQRRDEVPNQELARDLAAGRDDVGVAEMVANLQHKSANVQSDCLKVLYEVGYLAPDLIAGYVNEFLDLLAHKNNRMVWGGMIALSTIAALKPDAIWRRVDEVTKAVDEGSVITVVSGVKTLAKVAAADERYRASLFPYFMHILNTCIPRDVATHAESMRGALDDSRRAEALAVLSARQAEMTAAQTARVRKVIRQMGG